MPGVRKIITYCWACVAVCMLAGCSATRVYHAPWQNFQDAWHLSNGKANAVVVPEIGRVMWFGYHGGENLLWAQPDAARHLRKYADFDNYGGEKIWLWPQRNWPPSGDRVKYQASSRDGVLTMISDEIPGVGLRIVRQIRLDPHEPVLVTDSTLVPIRANMSMPKVTLWSVAQISLARKYTAKLLPHARPPLIGAVDGGPAMWPINNINDDVLTFIRNPQQESKSGMESAEIAAIYPECLLTMTATCDPEGNYDRNTRGQLYSQADVFFTQPQNMPPYSEIEFVAPWPTKQNPHPSLRTRMKLTPAKEIDVR